MALMAGMGIGLALSRALKQSRPVTPPPTRQPEEPHSNHPQRTNRWKGYLDVERN